MEAAVPTSPPSSEDIDGAFAYSLYGDFQIVVRKADGHVNLTALCGLRKRTLEDFLYEWEGLAEIQAAFTYEHRGETRATYGVYGPPHIVPFITLWLEPSLLPKYGEAINAVFANTGRADPPGLESLNKFSLKRIDNPPSEVLDAFALKREKTPPTVKEAPATRREKLAALEGSKPPSKDVYSRKAIEWLEYRARLDGVKIRHAENGGEYTIPLTRYKADGYCAETKTVYEFYGDYWHGNPKLFLSEEMNESCGKTFGELYRNTLRREEEIRKRGYKIIPIWESEWKPDAGGCHKTFLQKTCRTM